MPRRSSRDGEPVKTRGGKAATPKRRDASKRVRESSSAAASEVEIARVTRERDEALLRETANSEILRLISTSPGDLDLVFRTILEHATRICNANFGTLFRFDGENFYAAAQFNTPVALLEAQRRRGPFKPPPDSPFDHVMRTKRAIHSADNAAEAVPGLATKFGGARSHLSVPMLKDDALIGVILIYHQEVRPFTDKQIELVKNFAAQAVIAIENTRLLNELRQRTDDLSEALDQQTATSEVLKVISSSPGELEPVFQAMLGNAVRICDARFGILFRCDNKNFEAVALFGLPPAYAGFYRQRGSFQPPAGTPLDRLLGTKDVVRIVDDSTEPVPSTAAKFGGARSLIVVPMLKENSLIGAISIFRQEVRPFTDKQIELVTNFAAQAVIAIENTRLLNELRESLQQQTATADVLRIISSSPGELHPVFEAMLNNALHICGASIGSLLRFDGNALPAGT